MSTSAVLRRKGGAMVSRVGQQLGKYRLVRLLGRGGFAEVYLGEHVYLGTHAAIKVLYSRFANKDEIESFLREARSIAHLEHPHIVRVFDFDVIDDTPFLVMNYAPNGTLRYRHPRGTIVPLPTIASYVKQIAGALQYAHDQRLIHRDIKPENILVGQGGEVLVSDFGIATMAQSSRYQAAQDLAGTIAYMAPEQIQAHPRPASDQYSLGIIVYEWLSGGRPFHGSFTEIAIKHSLVPPPSLHEKMPALLHDVEQVVMTALAKDPKARFASVQAFATALEQATQSTIVSFPHAATMLPPPMQVSQSPEFAAPPPRPVHPPSSIVQPQQPASSAETKAASNQTSTPPGERAAADHTSLPAKGELASNQPVQPPVIVPSSKQALPQTISAPSGPSSARRGISRRKMVLGLGLGGLAVGGSLTWLASSLLFSAEGTTLYIYHGHSDPVYAVAWSPDGRRIASGGADQTVQVWDATPERNVYIYRGHSDYVLAVAWSPDGQHIASGSQTVQVWQAG